MSYIIHVYYKEGRRKAIGWGSDTDDLNEILKKCGIDVSGVSFAEMFHVSEPGYWGYEWEDGKWVEKPPPAFTPEAA